MILTHGTGTGSTAVTLPGAQFPFEYSVNRWQTVGKAEDGTIYLNDFQVQEYFIKARIKCSYNQSTALRSFLFSTVGYASATFNLTPDAGVNFGSGAGSDVAVRWWGNYQERSYAPSRFEIAMTFRREAT